MATSVWAISHFSTMMDCLPSGECIIFILEPPFTRKILPTQTEPDLFSMRSWGMKLFMRLMFMIIIVLKISTFSKAFIETGQK